MISVIIPCYNEQGTVAILNNKIEQVFKEIKQDYEIIFIDDGSRDNTAKIIEEIMVKSKKTKLIKFQKNFNKSAALTAGWKAAKGDIIIQLDADLQDDPREIPRFIDAINLGGFDLVSGWKYNRKDPFEKRIFSKFFNWLTAKITKVKIHDSNCGFKAYKKKVVQHINIYGELHRYIPALASFKGFRVGEIKVKHHPRMHGKSKYGYTRIFKGFFDLITIKFLGTYKNRPLHLFGTIGAASFFLGILSGLYLLYLKILGSSIGDRPLLILTVVLLFLGIQFISLGLIAEMMANNSDKERYVLKE